MIEKETINLWAVVQYTFDPKGDERRVIIVRETYQDAHKILTLLEQTDINFDVYAIEGVGK